LWRKILKPSTIFHLSKWIFLNFLIIWWPCVEAAKVLWKVFVLFQGFFFAPLPCTFGIVRESLMWQCVRWLFCNFWTTKTKVIESKMIFLSLKINYKFIFSTNQCLLIILIFWFALSYLKSFTLGKWNQ
jgi:hypothetical protein